MSALSTKVRSSQPSIATSGRSAAWRWIAGLIMAVLVAAYGYIPPGQNMLNTGWNSWKPATGYAWRDTTRPRQGVVWRPGLAHPSVAHVLTSVQEKEWAPEVGYTWVSSTLTDGVRWEPGQQHSVFENIAATAKEGYWQPAPGYVYSTPGQLSAGRWQPSLEHREYKNVVAGATTGTWKPIAGFRFEKQGTLSQAIWAPGSGHPGFPNVLAGDLPNQWKPAAGYTWVSQEPSDMRVAVLEQPASTSVGSGGQQEDRASLFFTGLFKALLGGGMAKPESDDGAFARNVGRPIAEALRNDGFKDMAQAIRGR